MNLEKLGKECILLKFFSGDSTHYNYTYSKNICVSRMKFIKAFFGHVKKIVIANVINCQTCRDKRSFLVKNKIGNLACAKHRRANGS